MQKLYAFFWVTTRCLNFICRCFGTLCLFHLHRQVGVCTRTHLPMKMEQTECSETSAYKIQTLGNHPKESTQHSGHGESLKSRICTRPTVRINLGFHSKIKVWLFDLLMLYKKYDNGFTGYIASKWKVTGNVSNNKTAYKIKMTSKENRKVP